tara:strand:- start:165 stop:401 length:237 start_codon:yes stop_codon:yes gene_type:complete
MNLDRAILEVLNDVQGHLMTTAAVHAQTRCATGADTTLTEAKAALHRLEREGEAKGVSHKDYGIRWAITDAGKLRLAE